MEIQTIIGLKMVAGHWGGAGNKTDFINISIGKKGPNNYNITYDK